MLVEIQQPALPVPSGSAELDDILGGGYASNRVHLLEGRPGSGKTTLALQFLRQAQARGENTLYITLSESREELIQSAGTHGWSLEGIEIYELVPPEMSLDPRQEQSVVYSADLELGETVDLVIKEVERVAPAFVVFDGLSDIRLLAGSSLRYRRQVLALKHFFSQRDCTLVVIDDLTEEMDDANLHSLVHGVIRLEPMVIAYGAERRRLRVFKMRGRAFRGGYHDYVIRSGGVHIFPRLVASEHTTPFEEGRAGGQRHYGPGHDAGRRAGAGHRHPADGTRRVRQIHPGAAICDRGPRPRRTGPVHQLRRDAAQFLQARRGPGHRSGAVRRGLHLPAGRSGGVVARGVDPDHSRRGGDTRRLGRRAGQPFGLSARDAARAVHAPADARDADLCEPARRDDHHGAGPARAGRHDAVAGRSDLSVRHRRAAALFRGAGRTAPRPAVPWS